AEKRYDATTRELRGLLFAIKRLKRYLFGTHFIVETDAIVLVHRLNGMLRWILFEHLYLMPLMKACDSNRARTKGARMPEMAAIDYTKGARYVLTHSRQFRK
ncbi:hypothetical protein QBC46DRAFT_275637, partial [Diplogelasinospora grovesii]